MSQTSFPRNQFAVLVLGFALLSGAVARFFPTWMAGFPINDGGMFAVMVEDLGASGYALPVFTSYNLDSLPYAYPPLGFYLGRILSDLTGWNSVEVARWLPAFFSSLAVGAFYLLAVRLLPSRLHAALATLFFALTPRAFSWFVEGGGITRSPAQVFMLLTFASVVELYRRGRRRDVLWSGLWGALAVLSHPEAAVHAAFSCFLLWVMLGRTRQSFLHSVGVAALVALLSAPWWVTVLMRHGLETMLAAAATGQKWLALLHLVFFSFTEEPYATLTAVLGLIGLARQVSRREWLLPLWLILPFVVEGRSAHLPAVIPLSMLAALAVLDVVFAALRSAPAADTVTPLERGMFFYLFLYLLFSSLVFGAQISSARVYEGDQAAMNWVQVNTPAEARFLVLTGSLSVSYDPVPEWFPALTKRHSVYTVQGLEWVAGERFSVAVRQAAKAQECLAVSAACVWQSIQNEEVDHIYLSRSLRTEHFEPLDPPRTFPYVEAGLRQDERLKLVYESEAALIFAVQR
ncbi:MAG: glycosyltransferase family 39 protein [Anaerolineales bacterium]|nr:glycosyltransferase family 39 protein [Anaerolineales bacterium]MDW8278824.1 hypothetical protein [Anaerolineales bacterium]